MTVPRTTASAGLDAFYAGLAKVADNFMPPATQDWKALNLPTYDPEKAKALIAESGVSADKLGMRCVMINSTIVRPSTNVAINPSSTIRPI